MTDELSIGKNNGVFAGCAFVLTTADWGWFGPNDTYQSGTWVSYDTLTTTYLKAIYFTVSEQSWLSNYSKTSISEMYVWQKQRLRKGSSGDSIGNDYEKCYSLATTRIFTVQGQEYAEVFVPFEFTTSKSRIQEVVLSMQYNEYWDTDGKTSNLPITNTSSFITTYDYPTYFVTSNKGAGNWGMTTISNISYLDQGGSAFSGDNSASLYAAYTYGTGRSPLIEPTKTGYNGTYWLDSGCTDNQITSISTTDYGDKTLYVKWTLKTYTITWKNADGTTLETDENVPHFSTPSYDGAPPTKTATSYSTFEFSGWSPEISSVSGNITYTAQYEELFNSCFAGGEFFYVVDKAGILNDAHLRIYVEDDGDASATSSVFTRVIYQYDDNGSKYNTYRVTLPTYTGSSTSGWTKFILLRCNPANDSATTKDTAGVWNESFESLFSYWGSFNRWWIEKYNSDRTHFDMGQDNDSGSNGFLSGQTYYFERSAGDFGVNKSNWAIYFCNMIDNNVSGNTTDAWTSTFCRLIEGHGAGDFTNGLFEFVAPQTSTGVDVVWHKVIAVRMNDTTSIGWGNKQTQGPDCILTTRNNVVKSSSSAYEQSYSVTDTDRLHFFASYFNKQTDGEQSGVCVYDGSTNQTALTTAWGNVTNQYPLKASVKHQFAIATADQYGSSKTQAAARYDYIVSKYEDLLSLSDFAHRKEGGHYSGASSAIRNPIQVALNNETSFATVIIIIASSISLLSITALSVLVIKKRKTKEQ